MSAFSPLVRYFEEVAEQKSIRRAAERLHIAPSAVTRQIAKFEELLGMPLFERLPRGVRLTAAGEVMLANVRRMQRDFEGTLAQVDSLKVMRRGKVRIGILQYMSDRLMPDLIADVTREHPGFTFTVRSANSVEIVDRIANGELDIGLCWAPPATAPVRRVRSVPVSLGIVVPAGHEWARRRSITLTECMSQPLIVPTPEMEQRRMLDSLLRGAVMRLQPLAETNSMATMIRLVLAGVGAAVMTRVTVLHEIAAGTLVHIPFTDRGLGQLALELLVRADRNLSPSAALVLQLLELRFGEYTGRSWRAAAVHTALLRRQQSRRKSVLVGWSLSFYIRFDCRAFLRPSNGTAVHIHTPSNLNRRAFALGTAASLVAAPALAQPSPLKLRYQCDWRFEAGTIPYIVALKKGYFAQEGLDVTLNVGAGAAATVNRLAAGNAEMGTGDMSSLAEFAANNALVPAKAVMLMYESTPAAVFSLRKTGVRTPADLRGRRLAAPANDGARRIFPLFAAANGLDPATDVSWTSVEPALRETMLARGQVEVITGYMASGWVSLQKLGVPADDISVMKYSDHGVSLPGNAIMASNAFLKDQPQAVAGFLRAVTRAVKDAAANRAGAVALLKEFEPLTDSKTETLRLDVALDGEIATPTVRREGLGGIDIPRYQTGITALARALAFKSTPDAASLVDTRFLPTKAQRMVFA